MPSPFPDRARDVAGSRDFERRVALIVDWAGSARPEPLVRSLTTDLTGQDPGPLFHACPHCGSIDHGRPYVDAAVHVSIAYAPGLTLAAVSKAGPVGIDVELRADVSFVRREAVGKALGVGIVTDDVVEPVWQAVVDVPGHVAVVALVTEQAARVAASRAASRRRAC